MAPAPSQAGLPGSRAGKGLSGPRLTREQPVLGCRKPDTGGRQRAGAPGRLRGPRGPAHWLGPLPGPGFPRSLVSPQRALLSGGHLPSLPPPISPSSFSFPSPSSIFSSSSLSSSLSSFPSSSFPLLLLSFFFIFPFPSFPLPPFPFPFLHLFFFPLLLPFLFFLPLLFFFFSFLSSSFSFPPLPSPFFPPPFAFFLSFLPFLPSSYFFSFFPSPSSFSPFSPSSFFFSSFPPPFSPPLPPPPLRTISFVLEGHGDSSGRGGEVGSPTPQGQRSKRGSGAGFLGGGVWEPASTATDLVHPAPLPPLPPAPPQDLEQEVEGAGADFGSMYGKTES
ncbi:WAS/WASL-interacting protein family member 3-like [Antechinus flavipes]|uniref:WAS/WASL-interacting protein family member 3-like n=1 Tax=Antechinus flavipes TaxID=38775 RepID=UPI0022357708|nr:WAS/WASL-interacting protein family member 3-like [Antechinus flavipes]